MVPTRLTTTKLNFCTCPRPVKRVVVVVGVTGTITSHQINTSLYNIHVHIGLPAQQIWELICVYGDPTHTLNKHIWQYIQLITDNTRPVCLIGDFNAVAAEEEKYGGSQKLNPNNRDFRQFVFDTGLVDLGFKGPTFTWNNRQDVSKAIFQRLDRVLSTMQWTQLFPMAYVNHLPRLHSDHAPILLRTQNKPLQPRNFKIETWWFNHQGFHDACAISWQQSHRL